MSNEKVTIQVTPKKNSRKSVPKGAAPSRSARKARSRRGSNNTGRSTGQLIALVPESERAPMQVTVNKLRRAANSFGGPNAVRATIAYYSDPLSNRPVLYCGPFANRKVARAAIHNVAAAQYNIDSETPKPGAQLPPASNVLVVFRDIRRSVIRYLPCQTDQPWNLNLFVQQGALGLGQGVPIEVTPGQYPDWSFATCTTASVNPSFHNGKQWAGAHKGKNLIWVDATTDCPADLYITFSGIAAVTAFTVVVCRVFDGEETFRTVTATTNGVGEAVVQLTDNATGFGSGYYTFCITEKAASPFDVQGIDDIKISGSADVFSHETLPGLLDIAGTVTQARVVALSGMYSNTAAPVNRQGKIAAFQASGSSCWEGYCLYQNGQNSIYSELAPLQDTTVWPADKGVYGFARPSQIEDFKFRDISSGDGTHIAQDYIPYDVCQESDYLIIAPEITSQDGRDGTFICVHAIEYVTTSQFIPMLMPQAKTSEHEAATSAMMNLDQWHENPKHISEIKKFVSTLASPARNIVDMAGKIDTPLSPLFKTLSKGIGLLENIF